jgi:hypothetical protein
LLDLLHSFTVGSWHGNIDEWLLLDEEFSDLLVVLLAKDGLDVLLRCHLDEGVLGLVLDLGLCVFGGFEWLQVHPLEGGTEVLKNLLDVSLGLFWLKVSHVEDELAIDITGLSSLFLELLSVLVPDNEQWLGLVLEHLLGVGELVQD